MECEMLQRQLERERLARQETEEILDRVTLELYNTNKRLQGYLNENELLLRQYKDAVDEGTIVSKTDPGGVINYVNDEFCRISGYRRDELVGRSHNIVRHPEMSSRDFQLMWAQIASGNSWKGIIKNRAKDGSTYIVKALIKPILDANGAISEYIAIREDITELYELQHEIIQTQKEMLERMGELAETRSRETGYHVRRVAEYSALLAELYGLPEADVALIRMASPMHDIGKIAIPDEILLKPSKLSEAEFEEMKLHAERGYSVFRNSKRELLKAAAIIARDHHERWDGSGYPRGLAGDEIHIYGRITALADVFDALGTERVYKRAWDMVEIVGYIRMESGKHFDPVLTEIFLEHLDAFIAIRREIGPQ